MTPRPTDRADAGSPTVVQAGEVRSASVESLRAIGASGVVICHVYQTGLLAGGEMAKAPVHSLLLTAGSGYAMLLVLSGYLLFRPFARRMLRGEPAPLGRYFRNRALRVLPLYYVAVVVLLVTTAPPVGWERWVVLLTLAGNFVPGSYQGINTPLLVLLVEVQFYALLPVLVALLRRRPSMRSAALVIGLLSLASVALRVSLLAFGGLADPERFVRASVLTMFHFFGAGMLLALLALRLDGRARRPSGWLGSAQVWLLGSVGVWLVMWVTQFEPLSGVASVLLLGAVVLPLRPSPLVTALSWRPLVLVGVATFSLYMWHLPVAQLVTASGWVPRGTAASFAVCLLLIGLVTLVSYALVEVSALSLRRPWAVVDSGVDTNPGLRVVVPRIVLGTALLAAILGGLAALRGLA